MPIPTTYPQAEQLLGRLRAQLELIDPELSATIIEPIRGQHQIAVLRPGPADSSGFGIAFEPHELDNGASGIADAALRRIRRLIGEEHPELVHETRPTVFSDVMTTGNIGQAEPGIGGDAVIVETVPDPALTEAYADTLAILATVADANADTPDTAEADDPATAEQEPPKKSRKARKQHTDDETS